MAEKDKLLRDLDQMKVKLHPERDSVLDMSDGTGPAHQREELKVLVIYFSHI